MIQLRTWLLQTIDQIHNYCYQVNHTNSYNDKDQPSINLNDFPLKVIIINCQSVIRKKAVLDNLIYEHKPVGTESWLKSSITSSEIFAPKFEVFRRDRSDGYEGVFLAWNKMYNCHWESVTLRIVMRMLKWLPVSCK